MANDDCPVEEPRRDDMPILVVRDGGEGVGSEVSWCESRNAVTNDMMQSAELVMDVSTGEIFKNRYGPTVGLCDHLYKPQPGFQCEDVRCTQIVQVDIRTNPNRLWANVDGRCALRIYDFPAFAVEMDGLIRSCLR